MLGPATATEGETGLYATMSVALETLLYPPAEIVLWLDGVAIRTWSGVTQTGAFEHTADVEPGVKHVFRFVATAGGRTAESGGSFTTRRAVDWFNVKWAEDGYATGSSWDTAAARAASGGSWTRPAGDGSSFDGTRLALAPPEEGFAALVFTPSKAVKANADVTVEGDLLVAPGPMPSGAPTPGAGGLVFTDHGPMGWTGGGWIDLQGATPEAGTTAHWKMEVALTGENAPAVRYTIGETALSDADGCEWFALGATVKTVRGVGFGGSGSVGNFRGFYKAQLVGSFEKPNFGAASADGDALGFGVDPATGKATFAVSIDNASADADYAVYVCATVDGDYVLDPAAKQTGSGANRTFTMVDDAAAKFVKIVAAEPGFEFPQHFDDIEF